MLVQRGRNTKFNKYRFYIDKIKRLNKNIKQTYTNIIDHQLFLHNRLLDHPF